MMNLLRSLFYFFTPYTGSAERRVGRFFRRVREKDAPHRLERQLTEIVQADIATVNLWTEHRYKGYNYLTKSKRRELYVNLAAIHEDFSAFAATQQPDIEKVLNHITSKGVDASRLRTHPEELAYLATIMQYLSPRSGRYRYRQSSSFGRLLRDPRKDVLVGDCNQIVTLYISLFAARYDVSHLTLTLLPGHVALHFHGVDIETTNATFMRYQKEGQTSAPLHEIVSVNLLDTTDTNFAKSAINPEVFLQAARLAYVVSSHRQLVKRNLEVAYGNTVRHLLRQERHTQALDYARQSKDLELIEVAARSGVAQAVRQYRFADARRFAGYLQQKESLLQTISQSEAAHLFNSRHYEAALKIYQRLGDKDMQRRCYRALYGQKQAQLGTLKTVADIKAQAGTIRQMERYARQSADGQLIKHVSQLVKYL